jgi:hypothetical protein
MGDYLRVPKTREKLRRVELFPCLDACSRPVSIRNFSGTK